MVKPLLHCSPRLCKHPVHHLAAANTSRCQPPCLLSVMAGLSTDNTLIDVIHRLWLP